MDLDRDIESFEWPSGSPPSVGSTAELVDMAAEVFDLRNRFGDGLEADILKGYMARLFELTGELVRQMAIFVPLERAGDMTCQVACALFSCLNQMLDAFAPPVEDPVSSHVEEGWRYADETEILRRIASALQQGRKLYSVSRFEPESGLKLVFIGCKDPQWLSLVWVEKLESPDGE